VHCKVKYAEKLAEHRGADGQTRHDAADPPGGRRNDLEEFKDARGENCKWNGRRVSDEFDVILDLGNF